MAGEGPPENTATEAAIAEGTPIIGRETLPSHPNTWREYRKHATTRATKIDGPFVVETAEGPLLCEDGFLAVDARGFPYPIATDEFVQIYEPAQPVEQLDFDRGVLRDLLPELRHKIAIGKAHRIMAEAGIDLGTTQAGRPLDADLLKEQVKATTKALERFEELAKAGEGIPFSKLDVVTDEITPAAPKGPSGGPPAA